MRRPAPTARALGGFTLLELMVVVVILGTLLLLVPANLAGFGARGRLEQSANTLASVLTGAREQAILDGYEVRVEIGWWQNEAGRHQGHRWLFTNIPPPKTDEQGDDRQSVEERRREAREARGRERQWLSTVWRPLPEGVRIAGMSEESKRWQKASEGEPYRISFFPDGSVQKAFAVRLESDDLEVKKADRTMTILVHGLTAEASVYEGEAELPEKRDPRDFP